MANSLETKQAIRAKIERLTNQKRDLRKQIIPLIAKVDRFKDRINSIELAIKKLQADLNG
jgi:peptidoglycan hydrolase CwlO-like protein